MTTTQPDPAPADLSRYTELADRLFGDLKIAPAKADGSPDWCGELEYASDYVLSPAELPFLAVKTDNLASVSSEISHRGTVMLTRFSGDGDLEFHQIAGPITEREPAERILRGLWARTLPVLTAANDNAGGATTTAIPAPRQRFELTWFDEIEEVAPKESIIQGAFGVGEFSTISGLPGTGKSVIATDAACHVAAGMEWHGRRVKQGMVVYIAAERKRLTERRMNAFRRRYGVKNVPLAVLGGKFDFTSTVSDARALVALVKQAETDSGHQCVWVIVDTLTRTFGPGDQNTSKDMTRYVISCDEILRGTGAHVTIVHHTAWSGERGKGAIDLDGAVDASFIVKKSGKTYTLECNGTNDGEEGTILNFAMESVTVGTDENGEPTTAPVVVEAGPGPAEGLLAALKGHAETTHKALQSAIADHGVEPDGENFPDNALVVTEDQWRAAFYATDPGVKTDTMKKRFVRSKRTLIADGQVNQVGQWFWVGT